MVQFDDNLMRLIISHEGDKFENDKDDQPTKYGIISTDIMECVDNGVLQKSVLDNVVQYIRDLSYQNAFLIIKHQYWDKLILDKLVYQDVANKICDMALLMGRYWVVKSAQRACRSVYANKKELKEDGIMGAKTIAAINMCFNKQFLAAFRSECAGYYRSIIIGKPIKEKYLKGWLTRAYK